MKTVKIRCRGLLIWCLIVKSQSAHAQSTEGFASNQLSAPSRPSSFLGLEPATKMTESYSVGVRASYLNAPLTFALAAPSETQTAVPIVSHLWLMEGTFAIRPLDGLDLGLVVPWNTIQTGNGMGAVTGSEGLLPVTAFGDPRLSVGYALENDSLALRGFGLLSVPLGSPESLSGEGNVHGDVGVAFSYLGSDFELSLDVRGQLRAPRTLGLYRLGSGLRVAIGASYRPTPLVSLSLEGYAAPTFETQPEPLYGTPASPLPAEILVGSQFSLDRYVIGLGAGAGLPVGRRSSVSDGGSALAPTVPAFRLVLELRYQF